MKIITEKEWEETPKDYKTIIDGTKYTMVHDFEKGTILTPVEIGMKKIKWELTLI